MLVSGRVNTNKCCRWVTDSSLVYRISTLSYAKLFFLTQLDTPGKVVDGAWLKPW